MPSTMIETEWEQGSMYAKYDHVTFEGNHYQSTMGANEDHQPNTSPKWWLALQYP